MKITRRQLKRIILEMMNELQASEEEVEAAKKELSDEGGAASKEQVARAVRNASKEDTDSADDSAVISAIMAKDEDIKIHKDGDVIDQSGLSESKKK